MAVTETLIVPVAGYKQPTVTFTLESSDTSIRFTNAAGSVVITPFTMANARKLFSACLVDGTPETYTRY